MWTKCRNSCQQRKLLLVAVVLLSLLFFFFFFIPAICLFLFLFYKNSVENNPYAELHIDDAGDCRRHCILYDNKTNNVTLYNNTNNTRARVRQGDRHSCEKDSFEIVVEQVRLEGGFKKRRKNQSGGVFEANCSRQMGQHKKNIFHQMFLCLHGGWQRFVCQMQIVIVLLEYKVEGDRTDTEGLFQRWNWSRHLKFCIECNV